ncbi:hypothetical protein ACFL3G_08505 [Planctomycetota bacterium]
MAKNLSKFVTAAIIYICFAVYLFQPYFKQFQSLQYLWLVNVCAASMGCFVLSRRWVAGFAGSFFAGAIYGFGPFMLGLAKYHPTAGLLVAAIPWLFCPSVFGPRGKKRWIRVPLSLLPAFAIIAFFYLSMQYRLFPIPIQVKLRLADMSGLLVPLVSAKRGLTLLGFYHVPVAGVVMGFALLWKARRLGVMTIFIVGTILAFCDGFLNVSPLIWLSFPVLCCSVIIGEGLQTLTLAGTADKKWILITAVVLGMLAITTLLFATKYFQTFAGLGDNYAKLMTEAAKMYILAAIATAIIFFMTQANLRVHRIRWILLCSAMAIDIFLGAGFIVDRIF